MGNAGLCSQNAVGLAHKDDPLIIAWEIEEDEPDNAQALPAGTDYGPPIPPAKVVEEYDAIRKADPTRPVFLSLGQGVAWDGCNRPRRAHQSPRGLRRVRQGMRHRRVDIYPVAH